MRACAICKRLRLRLLCLVRAGDSVSCGWCLCRCLAVCCFYATLPRNLMTSQMPTPAASNPNRLGPKHQRRIHSPETAQIAPRQPKGRNRLEAETAWAHCLPWPFSMSPRGRFSALNAKGSVPRVCFDQKRIRCWRPHAIMIRLSAACGPKQPLT